MSANNDITYTELASTPINKSRSMAVSTCSRGGYTIAQSVEQVENGQIVRVYMRGAMAVQDLEHLVAVRDAINTAIEKELQRQGGEVDGDEEDWDELDE